MTKKPPQDEQQGEPRGRRGFATTLAGAILVAVARKLARSGMREAAKEIRDILSDEDIEVHKIEVHKEDKDSGRSGNQE
jgi:hypothetical protein